MAARRNRPFSRRRGGDRNRGAAGLETMKWEISRRRVSRRRQIRRVHGYFFERGFPIREKQPGKQRGREAKQSDATRRDATRRDVVRRDSTPKVESRKREDAMETEERRARGKSEEERHARRVYRLPTRCLEAQTERKRENITRSTPPTESHSSRATSKSVCHPTELARAFVASRNP